MGENAETHSSNERRSAHRGCDHRKIDKVPMRRSDISVWYSTVNAASAPATWMEHHLTHFGRFTAFEDHA